MGIMMAIKKVYNFEDAPNIDLLDSRVIWWSESEICVDENKRDLNWRRDVKNVKKEVLKR